MALIKYTYLGSNTGLFECTNEISEIEPQCSEGNQVIIGQGFTFPYFGNQNDYCVIGTPCNMPDDFYIPGGQGEKVFTTNAGWDCFSETPVNCPVGGLARGVFSNDQGKFVSEGSIVPNNLLSSVGNTIQTSMFDQIWLASLVLIGVAITLVWYGYQKFRSYL